MNILNFTFTFAGRAKYYCGATIGRAIEEDFVFLVILGICTASVSFAMDVIINYMVLGKNLLLRLCLTD